MPGRIQLLRVRVVGAGGSVSLFRLARFWAFLAICRLALAGLGLVGFDLECVVLSWSADITVSSSVSSSPARLGIPEEFRQEFRIPDSSGRICRNDIRAGIAPELQVLRQYNMVLRTMLALQRPLNESPPEFWRNSVFRSGATPGGAPESIRNSLPSFDEVA